MRRKSELLGEARPERLAEWLAEELAAKGLRAPIGFRPAAAEPTPPGIALRDAA